jgi:hypothetical protein
MSTENTKALYATSLMGDPESDSEVIQLGDPVDLSQQDLASVLFEGAPLSRALARKSPAPRTPAGKAAKAAIVATASLDKIRIPHISMTNAITKTEGTSARIAGGSLENTLKEFLQQFPVRTIMKSVAGSADGAAKTISFNNDDLVGSGFVSVATPVVFLTVSSKSDSTRAGSIIGVSLAGKFGSGNALTSVTDTFERIDANLPIKGIVHPFRQIGERALSQAATFGGGVDDTLDITITGLFDGDAVTAIIPGYDSNEFQALLKSYRLNLV